jgi:hypothetical protein
MLESLRDLTSPRALVVRDGMEKRIAGAEVVRGDLGILAEGDRVPAADRLDQVRTRLPAGGNRIRTIGPAGEGPDASCVGSLSLRLFGWREPTRGDLKYWSCHAGPMVRIRSLQRRIRSDPRPPVTSGLAGLAA